MSAQPPFLLDTNIFITAAGAYYAFDLAPKFWDSLVAHARAGRLFTIDRVADEVQGEGELQTWMEGPFAPYVQDSGKPETLAPYAALMRWSQAQKFKDSAKAEFAKASVADAWVVAHAKAAGATVVTHEKYEPACVRSVKIPNACKFLGVECVDTYVMLRTLGVKLT